MSLTGFGNSGTKLLRGPGVFPEFDVLLVTFCVAAGLLAAEGAADAVFWPADLIDGLDEVDEAATLDAGTEFADADTPVACIGRDEDAALINVDVLFEPDSDRNAYCASRLDELLDVCCCIGKTSGMVTRFSCANVCILAATPISKKISGAIILMKPGDKLV